METKIVARTWNDVEAGLIRALLEGSGIPCSVTSDITHAVYPFTMNGLGEIRLSVPLEMAEEAERILADHLQALPENWIAEQTDPGGAGSDDD